MKLPVLLQSNAGECGIACLAMVASAHGRARTVGEIRRRMGFGALGNSLAALIALARTLDLHAKAVRLEPEEAPQLRTPCVLLWGTHHFVVLAKATRRGWYVHDPAVGRRFYRHAAVHRHFGGIALELEPATQEWRTAPARSLQLRDFRGQLQGAAPVLATIVMLSLLLQGMALVAPLYMQLVIDQAVARSDRDLVPLLALAFAALMAITVVTSHLRAMITLEMSAVLNDRIASNLCAHLLKLPFLYFLSRDIGDINARMGSLGPVLKMFTSGFVAVVIDGALAITTLVLICTYHLKLAGVVVGFLLVITILHVASVPVLKRLTNDSIRHQAQEQTLFIETLRAILSLKANGMVTARTDLWRRQHGESIAAGVRLSRLGARIELGRGLAAGTEHVLVVYLGALAVLDAELTIGMLYAFIAYKSHFTRAAIALVQQLVELKALRVHLDRVADIALEQPIEDSQVGVATPLTGAFAFDDLAFRYNPRLPAVLSGVNLQIDRGEDIAILGASGSGKSTLLKVLLGLIEPTTGTVTFDDRRPIASCRAALASSIGAVLQGDELLTGSIRDNVSLFALEPDDARIRECCRLAVIDDEIMALPLGYDTPLGDMGIALSAGQQQRLLLARAMYKAPSILVLDEATANLDDRTRTRVNENLRSLAITIVRVTHRADEIACCDRVYCLEDGKLHGIEHTVKPLGH